MSESGFLVEKSILAEAPTLRIGSWESDICWDSERPKHISVSLLPEANKPYTDSPGKVHELSSPSLVARLESLCRENHPALTVNWKRESHSRTKAVYTLNTHKC